MSKHFGMANTKFIEGFSVFRAAPGTLHEKPTYLLLLPAV